VTKSNVFAEKSNADVKLTFFNPKVCKNFCLYTKIP
jgi:hypothetical protein